MIIKKFHDRHIKPPRSGWSFPVQGRTIDCHSEQQLIEELLKIARANGADATYATAEKQIWEYFCEREPQRAKNGETIGQAQSDSDVLTPEVFGPIIWRMLNLAAARFQQRFFLQLLDQIPILMTCEDCRKHWREIVTASPPNMVADAKGACVWVNDRHNEVNARIGKSAYPYHRMVAEYGAPP